MTDAPITSEAELIAMLAPLTVGAPGALGLKDDCARLTPRPGYDLVLKTDPVRAGAQIFHNGKKNLLKIMTLNTLLA